VTSKSSSTCTSQGDYSWLPHFIHSRHENIRRKKKEEKEKVAMREENPHFQHLTKRGRREKRKRYWETRLGQSTRRHPEPLEGKRRDLKRHGWVGMGEGQKKVSPTCGSSAGTRPSRSDWAPPSWVDRKTEEASRESSHWPSPTKTALHLKPLLGEGGTH